MRSRSFVGATGTNACRLLGHTIYLAGYCFIADVAAAQDKTDALAQSAPATQQPVPQQKSPAGVTPIPPLEVTAPAKRQAKTVPKKPKVSPASVAEKKPAPVEKTAATGLEEEGKAAVGYRVDTVKSVGPFGSLPIEDAPYSISVVPHELIDNLQATTGEDVLRANPFVIVNAPTERGGVGSYQVRGFSLRNDWKSIDGISSFFTNENIEDKERVEVLQGVSGFLYGIGNPGGTVNYVLKRPTKRDYASITTGVVDNGEAYIHGDFGGPLTADGSLGYRLNIVGVDGSSEVDDQSLERTLVSGAVDWHATDGLLVQLDGSYATYNLDGQATFWSLASDFAPPPAANADKLWGAGPWTYQNSYQGRAAARVTWDINKVFTLRTALQVLDERSNSLFVNNTLNANGTYAERAIGRSPIENYNLGGYAFLDAKVNVGGIENKLTAGYYAFGGKNYFTAPLKTVNLAGTFPYYQPAFVPKPVVAFDYVPKTMASETRNENFMVADEVKLTSWLSVLGGVTRTRIMSDNYAIATGAWVSSYDDRATTPSVSVVLKPFENLTTYATYQEGFQQGATVSTLFNGARVTNAQQVLAPAIDKQTEVGAKLAAGGALWTVALFDLEKAAVLYELNGDGSYTASQNGVQEHKGVEVGVTGKLTDAWTVYAGFSSLKARYGQQSNSRLIGTEPGGIPELYGKLYSEYAISAVPGLAVNGLLTYVGSMKNIDGGTHEYPEFWVGDVGFRYDTLVEGTKVTWRAMVKNVTDEQYWASTNEMGQTRTFALTTQVGF